MKDRTPYLPLGRLAIAAMLAFGAAASQAADATDVLQPRILLRFSGDSGQTPGSVLYAQPVWHAGDQRLYGFTRAGGGEYQAKLFSFGVMPATAGRAFSVAADGTDYTSWSLGATGGTPLTNVVGVTSAGQTQVLAAGQNALRQEDDPTQVAFSLPGLSGNALSLGTPPSVALLAGLNPGSNASNVSPRGVMTADDKGNLYFGIGAALFCNAATTERSLYRRTPAGDIQAVVDFCRFADTLPGNSAKSYRKGGAPHFNFYSVADQTLYVLSTLSAQNGRLLYPDVVSGTDVVRGFLVAIPQAALDKAELEESDIRLMKTFTSLESSGIAVGNDGRRTGLAESGEWLYGTGLQTVWRLKKSDPNGTFAVVHTFPANANTPLTQDAGVEPFGDLLLAGDGNLYGVTSKDATQAGGGSLYRIVIGKAEDRSDDRIEFLHYFDAATEGSQPTGLSAGPIADGRQTLFGGMGLGLDGFGGLFAVDIAVPQPVVIKAFTASADRATVGDVLRLNWSTEHAVSCTAGGDNGNAWHGTQSQEGSDVAVTLTQAGDNTFALSCVDKDGGSASSTVQVAVAAQQDGGTTPGGETPPASGGESSSGGGGGPVAPLSLLALVSLAAWRRTFRSLLI